MQWSHLLCKPINDNSQNIKSRHFRKLISIYHFDNVCIISKLLCWVNTFSFWYSLVFTRSSNTYNYIYLKSIESKQKICQIANVPKLVMNIFLTEICMNLVELYILTSDCFIFASNFGSFAGKLLVITISAF